MRVEQEKVEQARFMLAHDVGSFFLTAEVTKVRRGFGRKFIRLIVPPSRTPRLRVKYGGELFFVPTRAGDLLVTS